MLWLSRCFGIGRKSRDLLETGDWALQVLALGGFAWVRFHPPVTIKKHILHAPFIAKRS